jgi:hypothetical protein
VFTARSRAISRAAGRTVGRRQSAASDPEPHRLLSFEETASEKEVSGSGEADRSRHGPVRVRVGQNAPAHVNEPALRLARHDADVALHGECQADTDRVPVDRGNHRFPHIPGRHTYSGRPKALRVLTRERLTPRVEVGARAEGSPGAGEDDCPDLVVAVALLVGPCQALCHRTGERVELLRPIQRDDGDAIADLIAYMFLHQTPPPGSITGMPHGCRR